MHYAQEVEKTKKRQRYDISTNSPMLSTLLATVAVCTWFNIRSLLALTVMRGVAESTHASAR